MSLPIIIGVCVGAGALCLGIVAAVVLKRRAREKTRPLATGPSPTFVIENPLFPGKRKLALYPLPDGVRASQLGDGSPRAVASWDTLRYDTGSGGAGMSAAVNGFHQRVNGEWGQLYDTGTAAVGHLLVPGGEEAAYEYDDTGNAASATVGQPHSATIKKLEQPWTPTYDLVERPHGTWHAGRATDPSRA
jgi:hypothetical protein